MMLGNFGPRGIMLLGTLTRAAINCTLAPTNASCLLDAVKEWVRGLWMPFFGAWRES
jgi:hypothetical protein